jgi:hypothetical protein
MKNENCIKIKESLPALVRDLFTFSSTVIKKIHNSITEHLNVQKKEKTKQKSKNSGADGKRSKDL